MRLLHLQTNSFKVVYVAPMKALAAEVTAAFAKRLEPLGEQHIDFMTVSCSLLARSCSHQ